MTYKISRKKLLKIALRIFLKDLLIEAKEAVFKKENDNIIFFFSFCINDFHVFFHFLGNRTEDQQLRISSFSTATKRSILTGSKKAKKPPGFVLIGGGERHQDPASVSRPLLAGHFHEIHVSVYIQGESWQFLGVSLGSWRDRRSCGGIRLELRFV